MIKKLAQTSRKKSRPWIQPQPGMMYPGGNPNFNESTGTFMPRLTMSGINPTPTFKPIRGDANTSYPNLEQMPRIFPGSAPPDMVNREQLYRMNSGGQAPPPGMMFTQDMVGLNPKMDARRQALLRYRGGM